MSNEKTCAYFITGTDTGCGKTLVSVALLEYFKAQGHSCLALKPVATGSDNTSAGLRNADALLLQQHSSVALSYPDINPFVYQDPVSPHLAAAATGKPIVIAEIVDQFRRLQNRAQSIIIEGVGGWYAPLSPRFTVADMASALGIPVILVVGLRLGCLNHAILSARAITQSGLPFAGWVANTIDPAMACRQENIDTLCQIIPAPLLASIPYHQETNTERSIPAFSFQRS